MTDRGGQEGLRVRRTRGVAWLWGLTGLALVAVAGWFVTHPEPLPVSGETVSVTTPPDVPVYVGVFGANGRTLHLRDVSVNPDGDVAVSVSPLVCVDGAVAVTSDPAPFCGSIERAEGADLGPNDQLMLRVTGGTAGSTTIDHVEVAYREALQWATQEAGPPVQITILGG